MNYLRDKRKQKNTRAIIALFFVAVVAVIVLSNHSVLTGLQKFSGQIGLPFWKARTVAEDTMPVLEALVTSKRALARDRDALFQQVSEQNAALSQMDLLKEENTTLRELWDKKLSHELVLADILARPDQSPYDTLIIDRGSAEGMLAGKKVFGGSTVLLGEVSEVLLHTSKVKLYSTAGEKMQVIVSGSNVSAEALGRGGQNFEMTFPRDVDIAVGAEVTVLGLALYPVAVVEKVLFDPRDPFQKILLKSPLNIQTIKYVQIEK